MAMVYKCPHCGETFDWGGRANMEKFAGHKAGCSGVRSVVPDPPTPPVAVAVTHVAPEVRDLLQGATTIAIGDPARAGWRKLGTTPPPRTFNDLLEDSFRDHQGSLRYLRDRDRGDPPAVQSGASSSPWGGGDPPETMGDAYDRILRGGASVGHADLDLSGEPALVYTQPVTKALRDARAYHAAMRREAVPAGRAARKALVGLVGALLRGRLRGRR